MSVRNRLRNIADGHHRLTEAPDDQHTQNNSTQRLHDVIDITIEARHAALVFRIEREH